MAVTKRTYRSRKKAWYKHPITWVGSALVGINGAMTLSNTLSESAGSKALDKAKADSSFARATRAEALSISNYWGIKRLERSTFVGPMPDSPHR